MKWFCSSVNLSLLFEQIKETKTFITSITLKWSFLVSSERQKRKMGLNTTKYRLKNAKYGLKNAKYGLKNAKWGQKKTKQPKMVSKTFCGSWSDQRD